jgi:hypothetical protein
VTRTLPSTRSTAWHEAAHAASLIMSGMTPAAVRVDQPAPDRLGSCQPNWEDHDLSPHNMRELVVSVILGPLNDGDITDLTEWPPDFSRWSEHSEADAGQLCFLIDFLQLDQIAWLQLLTRAQRLARDSRFRQLTAAIAGPLEDRELLLKHELEEIATGVLGDIA